MHKTLSRIFLLSAFLLGIFGVNKTANASPPSITEDSQAPASSPLASQIIPSSMPESGKWIGVPNQCEAFRVVWNEKSGKYVYKRVREKRTREDRERFKKIIRLVSREMGANQRLLYIWAGRESNYNPHSIHIMEEDRKAGMMSWKARIPNSQEANRLQSIMDEVGPQSREYWKAKSRLHKVTLYKDNPFYYTTMSIPKTHRNGEVSIETRTAWGHGQGPFGANPALWVRVWDVEAPPWILCAYDGVPSIIMQIWSAREAVKECRSQGLEGSYVDVNRRISLGHCKKKTPEADANFERRARYYGLQTKSSNGKAKRVRLGNKWPMETTDRKKVLDHMLSKIEVCDQLNWAKGCEDEPSSEAQRSSNQEPSL